MMGDRILRIVGRVAVVALVQIAATVIQAVINRSFHTEAFTTLPGWMGAYAFLWMFPSARPWREPALHSLAPSSKEA